MAQLDQRISGPESQREWHMAATSEVDALPGGLRPECGSGSARDLKGRGYRKHLEKRPKRDNNGNYRPDKNGNVAMCGGTRSAWNRGHRD